MRTIEFDEDVALAWSELLREAADEHGTQNFAWHMAERGTKPAEVRDMARRWRDEEFVPREFADQIEAFAEAVERLLEGEEVAFR